MTWWDRMLRWEDDHRFAVDSVGAALLWLVMGTIAIDMSAPGEPMSNATRLAALAVIGPLAWRRVRPVASAAAVYAAALAHMLLGIPLLFPADLVVLVALYSLTVHGPRWAYRVGMAGAAVGTLLLAVLLTTDGAFYWPAAIIVGVLVGSMFLAVFAFALVRRSRREHLEALVDRAERLEVERDQQAVIGAAAERARIAREMHDIVAHSLTVMIAQADGGRYAAAADPAAATRALGTIAETGRAALTDMRRLLGVLRTDADRPGGSAAGPADAGPAAAAGAGAAATAPQPAVEDLETLVAHMRTSGMRVSLVRLGAPRHLPPGAGLTVYRIAQESLTNVLKHAGPDPSVTVMLQWLPDAVRLEVSDDGRGAAADSDGLGQGLVGMRERAAMFGGTVTAGPRPGGGFRVRAELPTPSSARPSASASPAPSALAAPPPTPPSPTSPEGPLA
ncbi:sensor histidine kinase [Cellulomonas telluris]|uniref:sensor histidine kinase n=1 Tax=Cellulomonas telluris TaxID=2306636 RepID=UPI0010A8BAF6|nr:sensor histidine kinase [Cellulomonas telluris]